MTACLQVFFSEQANGRVGSRRLDRARGIPCSRNRRCDWGSRARGLRTKNDTEHEAEAR